jgi:hypothetical protein
MLRKPELEGQDYSPSTKDQILGLIFIVSGLLCFALSFTVFRGNGRPILFGVCLSLCLICLVLAENKKGLALALLVFLAIRVAWALVIRGLTT